MRMHDAEACIQPKDDIACDQRVLALNIGAAPAISVACEWLSVRASAGQNSCMWPRCPCAATSVLGCDFALWQGAGSFLFEAHLEHPMFAAC